MGTSHIYEKYFFKHSYLKKNISFSFNLLTLDLTCPLNINTLFIACNVFIFWFLVNNRTPILDTSLGVCFSLFPEMMLKISCVKGQFFANSSYADFHENLVMLVERNTESLALHNFCTSWLILFFTVFDNSFFASSISSKWFKAVLYCFCTIALQAILSCPFKSVLRQLPLNLTCTWNDNNKKLIQCCLSEEFEDTKGAIRICISKHIR